MGKTIRATTGICPRAANADIALLLTASQTSYFDKLRKSMERNYELIMLTILQECSCETGHEKLMLRMQCVLSAASSVNRISAA